MIGKDSKKRILADYKKSRRLYKDFVYKLEDLLDELLHEKGISVHSINGRTKSRKSLAGKLAKDDANYKEMTDLTDLAGLRIITHLAEDVDRIAAIIKEEFDIDVNNSVDKRRSIGTDRFGYLSLHHVFSLTSNRCELPEYKPFKGLKAELQMRSILQHAWAEIEHDLGYKTEIEVPQHIRRRFALVAGLLELADREFDSINNELHNYRIELPNAVQEAPESITLDYDSLQAYVSNSTLSKSLDYIISTEADCAIEEERLVATRYLAALQRLGYTNFSDIDKAILSNKELIKAFVKPWLRGNDEGSALIPNGIGLYYLWLITIAHKESDEIMAEFDKVGVGFSKDDCYDLKKAFIEANALLKADNK